MSATAGGYLAGLPFPADPFQREAAAAVDRGETVVVTAPTGSGKTVVAEAAIHRALGLGLRAVYTTPLKALSNQKFTDFRRRHGEGHVGLLTGDNSINGSAPIVVMTTEVLRNMMYAGSRDLDEVGTVVLDEVHYLQDRTRGSVWEEIIIHLDRRIPLVCLSATVANPEELSSWVESRRGPTRLVIERTRPVPLDSVYLVRDRWEGNELRLMPIFDRSHRPNEAVSRMLRPRGQRGRRYVTPRRFETVELLNGKGLLPAIYFIFSRAGCDAAAGQVFDFGLRLADRDEAGLIRAEAEQRTRHLSEEDLAVLGYGPWLRILEAGIAAHHAGLVPAFKETVEHLFAAGLVRLVFATETLSLGINMPARSVVLENLSKFTGDGHELLEAGDYTQLTGRAGRRGIDDHGTAVVLHSPYVPFERVAAIAGAGAHPLRSSFGPTYNMAANLIARYPQRQAEELLNASFAQFHEDRRRHQLAEALADARARLAEEQELASCELGDPFRALDAEPRSHAKVMAQFASNLGAGDVLAWRERGVRVRHAVVARGRGRMPRLMTVDEQGRLHRIAPDRLPPDTARVARMALPAPFAPRQVRFRTNVADGLRDCGEEPGARLAASEIRPGSSDGAAACPDLERHLAAARSARRSEKRVERLQRRVETSKAGLVPQLRSIVRLLERWEYADGWRLTAAGERLRFIYNELDLLLTESLERDLFRDLDPAEMAALASLFTYEPRNEVPPDAWPTERLAERGGVVMDLWRRLADEEAGAGLPQTRPPEAGFAGIAYRWAGGEELGELFDDETGSVGDFVRNCRQLIDLLRQIRDVAPEVSSEAAADAVDRGVVAAAGAV